MHYQHVTRKKKPQIILCDKIIEIYNAYRVRWIIWTKKTASSKQFWSIFGCILSTRWTFVNGQRGYKVHECVYFKTDYWLHHLYLNSVVFLLLLLTCCYLEHWTRALGFAVFNLVSLKHVWEMFTIVWSFQNNQPVEFKVRDLSGFRFFFSFEITNNIQITDFVIKYQKSMSIHSHWKTKRQ